MCHSYHFFLFCFFVPPSTPVHHKIMNWHRLQRLLRTGLNCLIETSWTRHISVSSIYWTIAYRVASFSCLHLGQSLGLDWPCLFSLSTTGKVPPTKKKTLSSHRLLEIIQCLWLQYLLKQIVIWIQGLPSGYNHTQNLPTCGKKMRLNHNSWRCLSDGGGGAPYDTMWTIFPTSIYDDTSFPVF